ncbi:MAG: hypothetical protein ON057_000262 [Glomeribacter sp. 1016415]|nr:hypothetical protein [Glomeribacter sp. 1016415]
MKLFKFASIIAFQTLAACGGGDESNTENLKAPASKASTENSISPVRSVIITGQSAIEDIATTAPFTAILEPINVPTNSASHTPILTPATISAAPGSTSSSTPASPRLTPIDTLTNLAPYTPILTPAIISATPGSTSSSTPASPRLTPIDALTNLAPYTLILAPATISAAPGSTSSSTPASPGLTPIDALTNLAPYTPILTPATISATPGSTSSSTPASPGLELTATLPTNPLKRKYENLTSDDSEYEDENGNSLDNSKRAYITTEISAQDTQLMGEDALNRVGGVNPEPTQLDSPPMALEEDRAFTESHKNVASLASSLTLSDITPSTTPPSNQSESRFIIEAEIEWVKEFTHKLKSSELLTNRRINGLEKDLSKHQGNLGENTYKFINTLIQSLKNCEPDYYNNMPTKKDYWGAVYSRPKIIKEALALEETSELDLNIYTTLRDNYLIDNSEEPTSSQDEIEWAIEFSEKLNDNQNKWTNESIKDLLKDLFADKAEKAYISENTFNFLTSLLDELSDAESQPQSDEFQITDMEYPYNSEHYKSSVGFRVVRLSKALNFNKKWPSSLNEEVYKALCLGQAYSEESALNAVVKSYNIVDDQETELSQSYEHLSQCDAQE